MKVSMLFYESTVAIDERGAEDEALAWAKKCPAAQYGVVEVRPVWEERPG